jgi:hypothetical protein
MKRSGLHNERGWKLDLKANSANLGKAHNRIATEVALNSVQKLISDDVSRAMLLEKLFHLSLESATIRPFAIVSYTTLVL